MLEMHNQHLIDKHFDGLEPMMRTGGHEPSYPEPGLPYEEMLQRMKNRKQREQARHEGILKAIARQNNAGKFRFQQSHHHVQRHRYHRGATAFVHGKGR